MTRKWTFHSVPAKVIAREFANRENWLAPLDKLFNETLHHLHPEASKALGVEPFSKSAYPKVNVISTDSAIEIEADIVGYKKEEISIQVEENILSIVGKHVAPDNTEELESKVYILRELKKSAFSRAFALSDSLDTSKIEATFENGLLTITIPRKVLTKETKVNKVAIK
jgi:HSP20 family protein